jgi:integrase
MMPTKKLTDLFLQRVKPPARGRVEYFDAVFGGLALRVTETGHKSWSLHYRMNGRLRRFTLGSASTIKVKEARLKANAALELVRGGIDPSEEKRRRRFLSVPEADAFANVLQDYLDRMRRNNAPRTYKEVKRVLEREALPSWRDRRIENITRGDINRVIDAIIARGADIQANRTLAHLRALFNWVAERGRIPTSPINGMKLPTRERARDRILNDDELQWLWQACEAIGWPFGELVKLLLLTAQRRDEVACMERHEFDLKKRIWTIPRDKTKNGRAHEVQLSDLAIAVLKSAPELAGRLVFTSNGTTPISGFSRAKKRIDAEMIKARRRSLGLPDEDEEYRKAIGLPLDEPLPVEIPHWTLHDLRRTAATGMARLNFPPHVVDKVLNHVSGTIQGVAAVYNRFDYLEERRLALETWGRYIENVKNRMPTNVVALHNVA